MVIMDLFIESSAKFKILINCSNDKLLLAVLFFFIVREKLIMLNLEKLFFLGNWPFAFIVSLLSFPQ